VGRGLAVLAVVAGLAVEARAAEQEQAAVVSPAELVVVEKRLLESGSLHRLYSEAPL
jgi:hypothetical protein